MRIQLHIMQLNSFAQKYVYLPARLQHISLKCSLSIISTARTAWHDQSHKHANDAFENVSQRSCTLVVVSPSQWVSRKTCSLSKPAKVRTARPKRLYNNGTAKDTSYTQNKRYTRFSYVAYNGFESDTTRCCEDGRARLIRKGLLTVVSAAAPPLDVVSGCLQKDEVDRDGYCPATVRHLVDVRSYVQNIALQTESFFTFST